jgi:hypothetical protein
MKEDVPHAPVRNHRLNGTEKKVNILQLLLINLVIVRNIITGYRTYRLK